MTNSALDLAHRAMTKAPQNDTTRLDFFACLADAEVFLLLKDDVTPETPQVFETSEGAFVLVFDTEDRISSFADGPAHYAALSGRGVATMLADQNVGIALNPDVAPSSMLIPPDAVDWLANLLKEGPGQKMQATPTEVRAPKAPPRLLAGLDTKLAAAAGLANSAILADVTYDDGTTSLLLALIEPQSGADSALAKAVSEALIFSGYETGTLDVAFFASDDPTTKVLERVGVKIDLPNPETPRAPGPDPTKPPRLR